MSLGITKLQSAPQRLSFGQDPQQTNDSKKGFPTKAVVVGAGAATAGAGTGALIGHHVVKKNKSTVLKQFIQKEKDAVVKKAQEFELKGPKYKEALNSAVRRGKNAYQKAVKNTKIKYAAVGAGIATAGYLVLKGIQHFMNKGKTQNTEQS